MDYGKILNAGFDFIQGILNKKSGTLEAASQPAPAQTGMPSWVVPVAIGVGLLLLLKKKLF